MRDDRSDPLQSNGQGREAEGKAIVGGQGMLVPSVVQEGAGDANSAPVALLPLLWLWLPLV